MYSSDQLLVSMQHRKKFRFDDEDRDDELLSDSSVDHIIKQFEDVFFSASSIKIIRKENICCVFKDLLVIIIVLFYR
jgi:hypothetical protein